MVGQTISHYRVLEKLGGGGMGVVYKAHDLKLDRAVALKFLPPEITVDPRAKQRFVQEAKAASSIDHPNICTVHDVEETGDGRMFIVMPCYAGETLKKRIERGPLQSAEAIDLASQIARGLSEAHGQGIVHRDIKPANILITNNKVVKILDFGLAKLDSSPDITKSGSRLGTTKYMAPEQVRAEQIDQRADIWSLGVVLYEMLTGGTPFGGDNEAAIMYSIVNDDPPSTQAQNPGISRQLDLVVRHATAKVKGDRYQTMNELASDLESMKTASSASGSTIAEAAAATKARSRMMKTSIVVGSLILILAVAYYVLQPIFGDEALASHPERVLTISFENLTGDTSLNYLQRALPTLLETGLEQSRYLQVVTQERMRDVMRNMGKGSPKYIDAELGTEICLREGIRVLISGSFARAGDLFVSNIKVLDPTSKRVLKSAESKGKGVESLFAQIDELSKAVQSGIGLSQRRIQENDRPVAQLLTESPHALDWYLKGKEAESDYRWKDASACYRKAITFDSTFAAAYWSIFTCEDNADNPTTAFEALGKAHEWQWRASHKVMLLIQADYAGVIEKNRDKRFLILSEIVKKYPLEREAYEALFYVYVAKRDREKKRAMLEKIVELDSTNEMALNELINYTNDTTVAFSYLKRIVDAHPKNTNALDTWAMIYFSKGQYDDALSKLEELARRSGHRGSTPWGVCYILACKEDFDGALARLESGASLERGLYEYFRGRDAVALDNFRLTKGRSEMKEPEDVAKLVSGWIHLEKKRYREARKLFELYADSSEKHYALAKVRNRRDRNPFYHFSLGYLELASGNLRSAQEHLAAMEIDSLDAHRRGVVRAGKKYLKGEILLAEGNTQEALRNTQDLDPGPEGNISYDTHMVPYNIPLSFRDLRARAWLKVGEIDSAITTYEQFMSPRSGGGRVHIISPVFHLRLGALYEKAGHLEKARDQYQILMRIWKNADANLLELTEVRSRFAKLKK